MEEKTWKQVQNRLDKIVFQEKFDLVVAIARGGIVPGFLISKKLKIDLQLLWMRFRDDQHNQAFKNPKLLKKIDFKFKGKKVLLVDDVCRTGTTFKAASKYLKDAKLIKTFAANGKSDYSLYDQECFKFPWN
jgi:xanthine phosphoribosyltransferase